MFCRFRSSLHLSVNFCIKPLRVHKNFITSQQRIEQNHLNTWVWGLWEVLGEDQKRVNDDATRPDASIRQPVHKPSAGLIKSRHKP